MRAPRTVALAQVLILVVATAGLVGGAASPALAEPTAVTIAGSLQSELGCPGDWQPECAATHLALDADDGVWQAHVRRAGGRWEYKAALNGTWDENYGLGARARRTEHPARPRRGRSAVKFYYDHDTHWVTDNENSVIATVPGSFQSELGLRERLGPRMPAFVAAGRRRRRHLGGSPRRRSARRLRGEGRHRRGVGRELRRGRRAERRRTSRSPSPPSATSSRSATTRRATCSSITVVPAEPVDDAALVREPVRHPFVDEVLYFTLPDRFNDGDPSNNCGDYAGVCVADDTQENVLEHGYLPSDKGYYHGGDIEGLAAEAAVPRQSMGISAIWVGPIYANKTGAGGHHQPVRALVRLPRLLDPRLPPGRSAPRDQRASSPASSTTPTTAGSRSSWTSSPTTPPT